MIVKLLPSAIVVFLLKKLLPVGGLLGVVIYGALFVALYCLSAYFIVMNDYEKGIVKKYLGKLVGH